MRNRYVWFVVAAFAMFGLWVGCEKMNSGTDTAAKADQTPTNESTSRDSTSTATNSVATAVSPSTIQIGNAAFTVEIAESDEQRAHGLMGRESLPDMNGMWFVFPDSQQRAFYMKDTLIPLDWIFVDADANDPTKMRIVALKADNQARDETPYFPSVPFKWTLEVNAGTIAKNGFKEGDVVQFRIGPK